MVRPTYFRLGRTSCLIAAWALLCLTAVADDQFDVLIRGGMVYDGSGGSPYRADVAVLEGSIAKMGQLTDARARTEIDAREMAVGGCLR